MSSFLKGILSRLNLSDVPENGVFQKATKETLFERTNPVADGEECLHDCESCQTRYPAKFKIDEDSDLYGHINGWSTHLLVATGASNWKRDVADEKGSIMEAVEASKVKPSNGRLIISASNMPRSTTQTSDGKHESSTTVLLLPAFVFIDNVTPSSVPNLIKGYVDRGPTTTTRLEDAFQFDTASSQTTLSQNLVHRQCMYDALILLCSHRTRDARCGQSAPLLKREFERHLRPLGLERDLDDERPGGVGIYFISHVGGHKFSANVLVYRRAGAFAPPMAADRSKTHDTAEMNGYEASTSSKRLDHGEQNGLKRDFQAGAAQCIWLARVRPADCENIIRYTVLQGKVVKPDQQLRGGFNRERCLSSW